MQANVKLILTKDGQEITKSSESDHSLTYTYAAGEFQAAQGAVHEHKLEFKVDDGIIEGLV